MAICTYNRADGYLLQALESAVAQTYPEVEILVSDNASEDRTEEVVRSVADHRIRYVRQPRNLGPNDNFNFCVREAWGDYFLLLHDDDTIDRDMVETSVAALEAAGGEAGVVLTGTRVVDGEGRVRKERPNRLDEAGAAGLAFGWIQGKTSLYLCSTLYNTRRLRAAGGFASPRNLFQDAVATLRLSAFGRVDVEAPKASFRRHGENLGSAAAIEDWAEDSLFVLETMCRMAPERAEELWREGRTKLCRENYHRARRVAGPLERWRAYWTNYRSFRFQYSPLAFLSRSQLLRARRKLTRAFASAAPDANG